MAAAPDDAFEWMCDQARRHGEIVVREQSITAGQLHELLNILLADGGHLGERNVRRLVLSGARVEGRVSFEGVRFSGNVVCDSTHFMDEVSFAGATFEAMTSFDGTRFDRDVDFSDAELRGSAGFGNVVFGGRATFVATSFARALDLSGLTFPSDVDFTNAKLGGEALFSGTRFDGYARFVQTQFLGDASFADAHFDQNAAFVSASLQRNVTFARAAFDGDARFVKASFTGEADFADVVFRGRAQFMSARFAALAALARVTFEQEAAFTRAHFELERELGPVHAHHRLRLDRAVFAQPVRIEVSARRVSLDHTLFRSGVDLRARWAQIWMEGVDFAGPSLVTQLTMGENGRKRRSFLGLEEPVDHGRWELRETPPRGFAPHVMSLRGAKVAQLTLSNVDLSGCRLLPAHGLDEIQLDGVHLSLSPRGWQRDHRRLRWSRRQTIAEEHHWRAVSGHGDRWRRPAHDDATPPAHQVAGIYRALRKSREDDKDEPGAADFYYGEMEMRRQRPRPGEDGSGIHPIGMAERGILWLYWAVAGYGLRASRAFAAFVVMLLALALVLNLWCFHEPRSYGRSVLFAAESSISLLRPPAVSLSAGGEVTQIVLRLAGPLLFGLMVLSLRARVKR